MNHSKSDQYEYFDDLMESRPFRYNGAKDCFEAKDGDQWVTVESDKCHAGQQQSVGPDLVTNLAFTSYQDWNAEPETSTEVPKSALDQLAKTPKGRAMQMHAEEAQCESDRRNQAAFDAIDFGTSRSYITELIEEGSIKSEEGGSVDLNEELKPHELRAIKDKIMATRVESEPEQEDEELVEKATELVSEIEKRVDSIEAPVRIHRALNDLMDLQTEVNMAVSKKQWGATPFLNEKLVQIAKSIEEELNKLRASNPDRLLEMIEVLAKSRGPVTPYKTALIHYINTHNSFSFSESVADSLKEELRTYARGGQGKGQSRFNQALALAYHAKKQADDSNTFIAKVTRVIPEIKLRPLLEGTQRRAA